MWLMMLARACVLSVPRPSHDTTRPCALEIWIDYCSHELPETGKLAVAAAPRSAHVLNACATECMSNFVLPSTLARPNKKPVDANIVAAATAMMILLGILISMDPQLRFPMFALRMGVEGSSRLGQRKVVQGQAVSCKSRETPTQKVSARAARQESVAELFDWPCSLHVIEQRVSGSPVTS
jgi:hypothetical protein